MTARVEIIAEAGVNHNGSLALALQLVDAAAEAGADVVKFQTFQAAALASAAAPKADYQRAMTDATESQLAMLKRLELGEAAHLELLTRCAARGIEFLSTPFDLESLMFLTQSLALPRLKLSSGEITNAPLLLAAARSGRPVLLSTGMSTLVEVEEALGVLAFGYLVGDRPPSRQAFREAYGSATGQDALRNKVTLLQCTTEYPAPFADANLRAMETMLKAFGLPVGFSDHTPGIAVATAAAALGAAVIEKHFTLDRTLPGPDHQASLEPTELKALVEAVRQVEMALGSGEKVPAASEMKNRAIARRCIVAARPIRAGEAFSDANLSVKRPGSGVSPMAYWELLGRPAGRAYRPDEEIES